MQVSERLLHLVLLGGNERVVGPEEASGGRFVGGVVDREEQREDRTRLGDVYAPWARRGRRRGLIGELGSEDRRSEAEKNGARLK